MPESLNIHKTFASYFPGFELWAYAVSEALEQGSICVDANRYLKTLQEGLAENPFLEDGIKISELLNNSDFVSSDPVNNLQPFILDNDNLYMQRYFVYQTRIVGKIKSLIEKEQDVFADRKERLVKNAENINKIFTHQGNKNSEKPEDVDWQKIAALNACLNNFSIITGGPGTGKTTTVAKILAVLFEENPEIKVALAAPTGKAAARMNESLQFAKDTIPGITEDVKELFDTIVPKTIHRLLGTIHSSTFFRHNSENPLPHDLIIIDEASMIDSALMYKLMEAVSPEKRIILLGDKNQLASVEAGSIFGDLCRTQGDLMNHLSESRFMLCNKDFNTYIPENLKLNDKIGNDLSDHVIQLMKNHRSESPEINTICRQVIETQTEEVFITLNQNNSAQSVIFDPSYNDNMLKDWASSYKEYIYEKDIPKALQKLKLFRALCAVREGKHGIYAINKRIEQILRTKIDDPQLFSPASGLYHNQLILVTANNYDLGVFNGDTGLIRRKSDTDSTLLAFFESNNPEKPIEIQPGFLNNYETVYAMTIHKSQGSEYDSVAVILPENENSLILTRELLYTAISRARKRVLIQSPEKAVRATIEREVTRASGISYQF